MKQYWVKNTSDNGFVVICEDVIIFRTHTRELAYAVAGLMLDVQFIEAKKFFVVERNLYKRRLALLEKYVKVLPAFVILRMQTELPHEIL